jgi:hypothetical protein
VFTIQHQHLQKPVNVSNHDFLPQQILNITTVDFISPRCTLGQWLPVKQTLAVAATSRRSACSHESKVGLRLCRRTVR